jgi:elongation factor P
VQKIGGIMATVSDFRNGMAIRHNGDIWIVTEFQHIKHGKGHAFIRTKLKNLKTGRVVDNTFRPSDQIDEVRLEEREMQYLYEAGEELNFMDNETYEQINLHRDMVGDQIRFLKEGNSVKVLFLEGQVVTVSLPMFIELKVTQAPPGVKGDTVSNLQKPITLETGAEIQAPLFIKEGDIIKIDTRDGRYIERISS